MYKPLPALPEEITPPSPSVMPTSDPLELPWDSLLFSNREAQACTDTKNDVNPVLYSSACILEVIPDVDPDHVTALITENIQECGAGVVERVLHTLFDDPRYPKIEKRGIMKKVSDGSTEEGSPPDKVNCGFRYDDRNRLFTGGPNYIDLAIVGPGHFQHSLIFLHNIGTPQRRLPSRPNRLPKRLASFVQRPLRANSPLPSRTIQEIWKWKTDNQHHQISVPEKLPPVSVPFLALSQ